MGVGKGYALSWMSTRGIFPLEDIVHIDPDHFKAVMPEWSAYVNYGKQMDDPSIPGNQCHRESCYMQEIALEESLKRQQHIWVDGSLSSLGWSKKMLRKLHGKSKRQRVELFEVCKCLYVIILYTVIYHML